jgi:neurofibromin 1
MYPSIQSKVWHSLGQVEDIIGLLLQAFIDCAKQHGMGSRQAEVLADTCVTLASVNVYLVAGKMISRLRKVGQVVSCRFKSICFFNEL